MSCEAALIQTKLPDQFPRLRTEARRFRGVSPDHRRWTGQMSQEIALGNPTAPSRTLNLRRVDLLLGDNSPHRRREGSVALEGTGLTSCPFMTGSGDSGTSTEDMLSSATTQPRMPPMGTSSPAQALRRSTPPVGAARSTTALLVST